MVQFIFLWYNEQHFLAVQCQESHREFCLTVTLLLPKIQGSHNGINVQPSLLGYDTVPNGKQVVMLSHKTFIFNFLGI